METAELHLIRTLKFEPARNTVHVGPVPEPPRLLMDAHMHIQSSKCATLPFLHDSVPGGMDRSTIEDIGSGETAKSLQSVSPWAALGLDLATSKYKPITRASAGNTFEVAKTYLAEAEQLCTDFRSKAPYRRAEELVFCAAVMTMDMEYAHLGGYFGLKIYNPIYQSEEDRRQDKDPVAYWYPEEGTTGTIGSAGRPSAAVDTGAGETAAQFEALRKRRENEGVLGAIYDANGKRIQDVPIHCRIKMAPKEETKLYEGWKKQLRYTKQAVIEGKLKLLPMFHYDPRRWQGGNSLAFREVGSEGLYLGFKMYTAQGYRPWDPRLPNLPQFYAKCEEEGIPILNHCTPEGAPTYDRERYILFTHPQDTAYDEAQKVESMKPHQARAANLACGEYNNLPISYLDDPPPGLEEREKQELAARREERRMHAARLAAKDYFNEHFVSPKAWRMVLDKHPKLRLCLAHFGGATKVGRAWGAEIITMLEMGLYPNLYVDISSSFADEKFRNLFKILLHDHPCLADHVLFGTDWYLTLKDGFDFPKYCQTAKEFLDSFDRDLWPQFTQENPYRFYRLGEQIGRIARGIVKEKGTEESNKRVRIKGRDTKTEMPKEDLKTFSNAVNERAKVIQDMASTLSH